MEGVGVGAVTVHDCIVTIVNAVRHQLSHCFVPSLETSFFHIKMSLSYIFTFVWSMYETIFIIYIMMILNSVEFLIMIIFFTCPEARSAVWVRTWSMAANSSRWAARSWHGYGTSTETTWKPAAPRRGRLDATLFMDGVVEFCEFRIWSMIWLSHYSAVLDCVIRRLEDQHTRQRPLLQTQINDGYEHRY